MAPRTLEGRCPLCCSKNPSGCILSGVLSLDSMPVSWRFQHSVLVLTLEGKYAFEEPTIAVSEAMGDPQFHAGAPLIIDVRRSKTGRSSEEFRARACWMASLVSQGISPRCAMVVGSQPHQYGLARMAGIYLESHNIVLEIFHDLDEAIGWLTTPNERAHGAGANS